MLAWASVLPLVQLAPLLAYFGYSVVEERTPGWASVGERHPRATVVLRPGRPRSSAPGTTP
jgi:hypothetical protein